MKIKDRLVLGLIAGFIGSAPKTLIDEISLRQKISQRSFRETAAGVWVNKRKEAKTVKGQLLGGIFDAGLSMLGGNILVRILSKTGRDHVITKGVFFGATYGSIITALLSGFSSNKVRPKDAASNLSYVLSHAAYGLTTGVAIAKLGDPSLFDTQPENDYLAPTTPTTEQIKLASK
ncbi:hypothetical protein CEB3_c06870 [Peptococcaceae bacterium CEB3]|nr:hypothetical protein CEB3_c06870 [Peptococcaceae bacterium CEB3]